jgi:Transcriptional regulator containing an amidase domain and an AraC-type DNA-binding HTH domain
MNPNEKNKIHYIERLNKVFDYIDENIDAQLNLDDLTKVSHFSKFHFSRIFSALVGETPFKFIQRIRLERANYLLQLKPKAKKTEIAFECGFNDLAAFSRQFTLHFNISPTAFKKTKHTTEQYSSNFFFIDYGKSHSRSRLR